MKITNLFEIDTNKTHINIILTTDELADLYEGKVLNEEKERYCLIY